MHDITDLIRTRLARALADRIRPARYGARELVETTAFAIDGEPISYSDAMAATFDPIAPGTPWGTPWGTTWFRAAGRVPDAWRGQPVVAIVELGFTHAGPGFQAEAMLWEDGVPKRGIHPRRRAISIVDEGEVELVIEAASNPSFVDSYRPNPMGSRATAPPVPLYTFGGISIAVAHPAVEALIHDLDILRGVARACLPTDPRRARIWQHIERALDALDYHHVADTADAARAALEPAFAVPARASSHRIVAVGHAHIDTAWLWPLRETVRKCARTFSSAIDLMRNESDYRFVCSQAAQYDWMERHYPTVFSDITDAVERGQWIPVGGMWVEADMNVPSGESIARQLIHGQRYFESRFGSRCREVWIPDVFGYPGSLPQIFAAGGCDRFVTQKLSWNKQNRMPHHTFRWYGIDGTAVLAHFPPVDTYNAEIVPRELDHATANFRDHAWSDWSLMPYGYGDGGGGPTIEMLERARRVRDLDGMPRVELGTVDQFFDAVEAEAARSPLPEWRGELYFEMHRATLTSQANTKVGNRRVEGLLREAELWLATLGDHTHCEFLDAAWKELLVLQFHDIIPGSSITWVYEDAEAIYARLQADLDRLITETITALGPDSVLVANAAARACDEIVVADVAPDGAETQRVSNGGLAFRAAVKGLAVTAVEGLEIHDAVTVDGTSMQNRHLRVEWDTDGWLTSIVDRSTGREMVRNGARGALLELAPDHPNEYDAWDIEEWTHRAAQALDGTPTIAVADPGPLIASVHVRRAFGASTVVQTYTLRAGSPRLDVNLDVDWREDEKVLTIDFPLAVHADRGTCEIQFGLIDRPTHRNTSWDAAKFEVCAHRFVALSEPDFGVAILNDGRYGHAFGDDSVRVTVLRAPNYPDPTADRGRHQLTISVMAHHGDLGTVLHEAECLNNPLRVVRGVGAKQHDPVIALGPAGIGVSAVKLADDGSGDLIVRVWEALGRRVPAVLTTATVPSAAYRCNLLEERLDADTADASSAVKITSGAIEFVLRPFELATLRVIPG